MHSTPAGPCSEQPPRIATLDAVGWMLEEEGERRGRPIRWSQLTGMTSTAERAKQVQALEQGRVQVSGELAS